MDQRIPDAETPIGTTRASEIGSDSPRSTTDQIRQAARQAGSQAAERIESAVGQQKQRATGELGAIADALRQAGGRLESGNNMSGRFIQAAADRIEDLSTRLDNRDLTQMAGEVRRWARRNPGAFVGAAVAVGFLASRFLKASEEDTYGGFGDYDEFESYEGIGSGADFSSGAGTRSGSYGAGSTGGTDYTSGGAGSFGGSAGIGGTAGGTGLGSEGSTGGGFGTTPGSGSTGNPGGAGTTGGLGGVSGSGMSGTGASGLGGAGTTGTATGATGSEDDRDGGRYGRS